MQQVHNGAQQDVELAIYKNGVLSNADGTVTVNITDADTGYAFITNGSATNLPASGKYSYELTPDVTSINCVLKIVWSYQLDTKNTSQTSFVEVVTPYATVSDIIEYYNIGAKPSDVNYQSEIAMINADKIARTMINNYSNQNFGRRYGYQETFGNGSDACTLVEKMITLEKVYENDTLVIDYTSDPVYNTFGYDLELTQTNQTVRIRTDYGNVRYDNQVDPTILYYGRFRDHVRYKFFGQIGYNYVPQDIKLCALLLVGDLLSRDSAWRTKYLAKVNLAEVSFEMAGGAFSGTGNVIVDQMLDQYRNLGIIVI